MQVKNLQAYRSFRWIIAAICITALATLSYISTPQSTTESTGITANLVPPAFYQPVSANSLKQSETQSFLEEIAGLSAHTQVSKPINLERIKPLFSSIETETAEYIVGIIHAPGYEEISELEETFDVHVYVHQEGWIVAYLLKWQPAAQTINWIGFPTKKLTTITLEDVISMLLSRIGASTESVSLYHFQHPNATSIMFAADQEETYEIEGTDGFQIEIPNGLLIYESSFSHASVNADKSIFSLNEKELSTNKCGNCWAVFAENFSPNDLYVNKLHQIDISLDSTYRNTGSTFGGIAVIYGQGEN